MTAYPNESIATEPFDREYGLEELLPIKTVTFFCRNAAALLPNRLTICRSDGSVYFQTGIWTPEQTAALTRTIAKSRPEEDCAVKVGGDEILSISLCPLIYELEAMGYLALGRPDGFHGQLAALGRAGAAILQQFMHLKHQTMLTSGLHGIVVEASYARLKEKAELLAVSEEKYRTLSANLEIEVRKKTEEIRKAHAHLIQQEKLAAIGQLSAGMAHEINNPLGFIISNMSSLKNYTADMSTLIRHYRKLAARYKDSEDTGRGTREAHCRVIEELEETLDGDFILNDMPALVDESLSGAERIKKIVGDLKTVARPGENSPEMIDVHQSIEAVLTIVNNRIGPGMTIMKSFSPLPHVPGYPQEISQVWLNLILNALDAMGAKGTLRITTRTAKNQVMVTIGDTGPGISRKHLTKIFEPFFTTKDVGQGTGLGLHIVYHLVNKHKGRIEVNSNMGRGTTFTVHIPAERE